MENKNINTKGVTVYTADDKLVVEEANLNYLINLDESKKASDEERNINVNIIFNLFNLG